MTDKTRISKDILWLLVLLGAVASVFRIWFGLGATTNLSDAVPWGLWKILNMVAGVALSTGGFTIGFLVYVLRIKRFKPLVRPAILIAFLGYGCSCVALLLDIGLPQRFWHPIVMWNEHSFLFEVFWCVLLYFTVTFIELCPTILARSPFKTLEAFLHKIVFGVVIVGISLSSLHHSSLGSLFLVTPQRLHPLWYSELLPLFFIISAMGAGMMVVVLIRIIYARLYDPEPVFGKMPDEKTRLVCSLDGSVKGGNGPSPVGRDIPMLRSLAIIAVSILGIYFAIKLIDFTISNTWGALFAGTWESWLLIAQMLLMVILPFLLVILPRTGNTPTGLGFAAFSAAAGMALQRLNVGIFGYFWDAKTVYFPSLIEWAVCFGVVAAAGLLFLFITENFSVFDEKWKERKATTGMFRASFDSISHVWNTVLRSGLQRVTLMAVFAIPIAWVVLYPPYANDDSTHTKVRPSLGLDTLRQELRIDGNRQGLFTDFSHEKHQQRMGGKASCWKCHHISMPQDASTPCSQCHRDMVNATLIFDHFSHMDAVAADQQLPGIHPENHSCVVCHPANQAKTPFNAKSCLQCHERDMGWTASDQASTCELAYACNYRQAMHHTCIPCHQREADSVGRPELGECSTCHQSLRARNQETPVLAESKLDNHLYNNKRRRYIGARPR